MVRETLIMGVFPNGAYSYLRTIVAVCKKCLTNGERKELKLLLLAFPDQTRRRHIETSCGGCGQRIMTLAKLRKGGQSAHALIDAPSASGEGQRASDGSSSESVNVVSCSCRSDPMRSIVRQRASSEHIAAPTTTFAARRDECASSEAVAALIGYAEDGAAEGL
jgi:hypothetical protein